MEIDKERDQQEYEMWQAHGGQGKPPERLLQEYELPDVYRIEEPVDTSMDEFEFGRGQRSKEHVRYDDGLTEKQWVRVCKHLCTFCSVTLVLAAMYFNIHAHCLVYF
jgi:ATP-dependent helicase STH1/SNF2